MWSENHKKEAEVRLFELAAAARLVAHPQGALTGLPRAIVMYSAGDSASGADFVRRLSQCGFTEAQRRKELRRVDGLATGRLVRETWTIYRVRVDGVVRFDTDKQEEATMAQFEFIRAKAGSSATFSTVTRTTIRRAR